MNTKMNMKINTNNILQAGDNITEMLKGVLEGCVLEIISRKETYGYEITRELNALGFEDVVDGTVYTILVRLEKNKLVDTEQKKSNMGPPRKFFRLNDKGRAELESFWRKWAFVSSRIEAMRRAKSFNFIGNHE
ncbi:MAG: PadR family transcriptional regulator [Spirochaetaceae bacterium]|jgi:DNA-binding PadR family transcriptional regulator|nr:PadR family transcriptional regulator [Spirochaetaceae bacterium]